MHRFVRFFGSGSFVTLLFHLGLLFFCWPLLSLVTEGGGIPLFVYLFIGWCGLVGLLFLVGVAIQRKANRTGEE